MLFSGFSQEFDINTCPRTIFCNNFEGIHMSGVILNDVENIEDEYEYGFTC